MKDEHPVKEKASLDEPPEAGNMRANDARRRSTSTMLHLVLPPNKLPSESPNHSPAHKMSFVFRSRNQLGRERAVRHESVDEADNDRGEGKSNVWRSVFQVQELEAIDFMVQKKRYCVRIKNSSALSVNRQLSTTRKMAVGCSWPAGMLLTCCARRTLTSCK
jgi:hypothetical protein